MHTFRRVICRARRSAFWIRPAPSCACETCRRRNWRTWKRKLLLFTAFAPLLPLAGFGCGTIANLDGRNYPLMDVPNQAAPLPFGGVANDVRWMSWGLVYFAADVPFSVVADVVTLPAALGDTSGQQRHQEKVRTEISLKDLPDFFAGYRVDPYIEAAAMLQASGKDKGEFRSPGLGCPAFFGGTDDPDWPLEPIELVDGVPFLILRGYYLTGVPESADSYLKYCIGNCAWNTAAFQPKSRQQKRKALEKLMASPKWKGHLGDSDQAFLSAQL